jgi:hypothetical protein
VHKLYSVSETVSNNVYTKGDAGSRFDGRNSRRKIVGLLYYRGFCFTFEKMIER